MTVTTEMWIVMLTSYRVALETKVLKVRETKEEKSGKACLFFFPLFATIFHLDYNIMARTQKVAKLCVWKEGIVRAIDRERNYTIFFSENVLTTCQ